MNGDYGPENVSIEKGQRSPPLSSQEIRAAMTDPATILEEFCVICTQLRMEYNLYRSLFEDDPVGRDLCMEAAPYFFSDLNGILVRNVILQFCRVTDSAGAGIKINLTTNYILKAVYWPKDVETQLTQLNDRLMAFRGKIEPARSKRVAHIDVHAQIGRVEEMGKFPPGEEKTFLADLQKFVDIAHGHLHGGASRSINPAVSNDTYAVVRAFEKAALYDRCYRCGQSERAADLLDFEQRS
jgi:HEPN superfamily AbiU2-like protein